MNILYSSYKGSYLSETFLPVKTGFLGGWGSGTWRQSPEEGV